MFIINCLIKLLTLLSFVVVLSTTLYVLNKSNCMNITIIIIHIIKKL